MSVCGTLNLEVAEEDVGAEEGEGFVEDIVGFGFGVDVEGVRACREGGKGVCWASGLCAEREEGKVACEGLSG